MTHVTHTRPMGEAWEKLLVQGELQQLTPEQRAQYYLKVCESLGLNQLTRPFDYITLNGKLQLYARKDATDQLRNTRRISISVVSRERIDDIYMVTARATDMVHGRTDESIGAISVGGMKGLDLANAFMKCETKAKRRVTLSICGLGFLDELDVEDISVKHEHTAPPDYLPGVTPKVTAETFVANLNGVQGALGIVVDQISAYLKTGDKVSAEKLRKAAETAGMKFEATWGAKFASPITEVPEGELLPFERETT